MSSSSTLLLSSASPVAGETSASSSSAAAGGGGRRRWNRRRQRGPQNRQERVGIWGWKRNQGKANKKEDIEESDDEETNIRRQHSRVVVGAAEPAERRGPLSEQENHDSIRDARFSPKKERKASGEERTARCNRKKTREESFSSLLQTHRHTRVLTDKLTWRARNEKEEHEEQASLRKRGKL